MKKILLFLFAVTLSSVIYAQAPVAGIGLQSGSTNFNGCEPLTLNLKSTSTGTVVSYAWSTSSGATSTLANPTFTFPAAGNYTITLKVTNASGSNTATQNVVVYKKPDAKFTVDDQKGCIPFDPGFNNMSVPGDGAINTYIWDFGDGSPLDSSANPTYSYTIAGTYGIVFTVKDANGCQDTAIRNAYISVANGPSATITSSPASTITCELPFNPTFTGAGVSGTAPYTYSWNFGDPSTAADSSLVQNTSYVYSVPGAYTVDLTVTDAFGCKGTITRSVVITPLKPSFIPSLSTICQGSTIFFTNTTTTAGNYSWNFGDGQTSVNASPSHAFTTADTFYVSLTVTQGTCANDTVIPVIVNPTPAITFTADTTHSCQVPFEVNFATTSDPAGATYSWSYNDNFAPYNYQPGSQTGNFVYTQDGSYTVSLQVKDVNGCTNTLTKTNYIVVDQVEALFIGDTLDGCVDFFTQFTNQSTPGYGGGPLTYSWSFENMPSDDTSNIADPLIHYTDSGTFDVTLIVHNALGCKDSLTKVGYIKPGIPPIPNFWPKDSIICHGEAIAFTDSSSDYADEWIWDFEIGNNTIQNPTFTYDTWPGKKDTGWFYVQLVAGYHKCYDTLKVDSAVYVKHPSSAFYTYQDWQPGDATEDNIICKEESHWVTFIDSTLTDRSTSTWTWTVLNNNEVISNSKDSVSYYFARPGIYNVKLKVQGDSVLITRPTDDPPRAWKSGGCADSTTKQVYVSYYDIDFTASESACVTYSSQFVASYIDSININTGGAAGITPFTYPGWVWDYGDGTGDFDHKDTIVYRHTYVNPNANIVQLNSINTLGCQDSALKQLISKPLPIAGFSLSATNGCSPLTVTPTDLSHSDNGGIATYTWTFGNGQSSNSSQADTLDIVYVTTGGNTTNTYNVILSITDSAGCKSAPTSAQPVTVTMPNASFSVLDTDSTICNGGMQNFSATSSAGTSIEYMWNYGDGSSSGGFSTTTSTAGHTYNISQTDTFNVILYVKDINGCIDSMNHQVIVDQPIANFGGDVTFSDCPPLIVNFKDSSTSSYSYTYLYSLGNGVNSGLEDPQTSYTQPGTYDVQLIITDLKGCKDTLLRDDYIKVGGPKATFSYNTDGTCPPFTINITTANVTNVSQYVFVYGDGNVDTVNLVAPNLSTPVTISHVYENAGTFTPVMYLTDTASFPGDIQFCDSLAVIGPSAFVLNGPVVDFTSDKDTLCDPSPITFTNLVSPNGSTITGYQWDFGDGTIDSNTVVTSTINNPVHNYAMGNYDVTLTVFAAPNCKSKITKENWISIFEGPDVNANFTGTSCPPFGKQFSADTAVLANAGIHAISIHWDFGDGDTSNIEDPFHTYDTTGTYNAALTVQFSNGCDYTYTSDSAITVHPVPVANFTNSPVFEETDITSVNFENTSTGDTTWLWTFGDMSASSVLENPVHAYGASGTYDVQLIAYNEFGCSDTILQKIKFDFNMNIPNIFTPNGDGVNDVFDILIEDRGCTKLEVYDRWGKMRYSNDTFKNDWTGVDSKGKRLPVDTYYYIIHYCDKITWNGWVMINYND